MARLPLSQLVGWTLADPKQDLRGLAVHNESGEALGTVTDMLVDMDAELVDGVVLDNGRAYALKEIERTDSGLRHVRLGRR